DFIKQLTRVEHLLIGKVTKPKNAAVSVVGSLEVYVPLEGLIDFGKEKARLSKEEARIGGEIKAIAARLRDKNFTKKAPKEVVEKQEVRKSELELQVKKIKDNINEA
ncbi:MAG: valine--tRNA ligase, partial [Candidatus Omnitrophica bacterium]|nr:valine--tRNA ligase [Candidatus Omnitrophota bacterium]